jgi:GTP-binding protein HflX
MERTEQSTNTGPKKAVIVGVEFREPPTRDDGSFAELPLLIESLGLEVAGDIYARPHRPNLRTLVGEQIISDIKYLAGTTGATTVVFNDELKGRQRNNLEDELQVEVVDRAEVILQIFADRAKTREGKIQVELAQLLYSLPRLRGHGGQELSALGGGIGTRGPGETKLETDARAIRDRIAALRGKIRQLSITRGTQRKQRMSGKSAQWSLIGYTNSGKTTLLNALTGAEGYADDRLFATLDPLTRKGFNPVTRKQFLVTDTVGFIQRLPTQLVAAFQATLEEVKYADYHMLIVDASDDDWQRKLDVVHQTLDDIGVRDIPHIVAYNKIDKLEYLPLTHTPMEVFVSALKKQGFDELHKRMAELEEAYPIKREIR